MARLGSSASPGESCWLALRVDAMTGFDGPAITAALSRHVLRAIEAP